MFGIGPGWLEKPQVTPPQCNHRFVDADTVTHWFLDHQNPTSIQDQIAKFMNKFQVIEKESS
jgi:hypothetical protein